MDTISQHSSKLIARYIPSPESREIIQSAVALANAVLRHKAILPKHKRKMLKEAAWLVSEADGKHSTRYRTKRVVELATKDPQSQIKIQHEHVVPRAAIADQLFAHPNRVAEILNTVVACIVTQDEHNQLNREFNGWKRYSMARARIEVYDMEKVPPELVNLEELEDQRATVPTPSLRHMSAIALDISAFVERCRTALLSGERTPIEFVDKENLRNNCLPTLLTQRSINVYAIWSRGIGGTDWSLLYIGQRENHAGWKRVVQHLFYKSERLDLNWTW